MLTDQEPLPDHMFVVLAEWIVRAGFVGLAELAVPELVRTAAVASPLQDSVSAPV